MDGMFVRRLSVALLLVVTACSTPVPVRFSAHARSAPLSIVSNPSFEDGDPAAGRRAFIALRCIDCHRVAEDPALPRGPRAIAGPLLNGLDRVAPREVARRITSRLPGREDLYGREMKDYAEPITARQLVDIVAYLRSPRRPGD